MKKINFRLIGSLLVVSLFLVMAVATGDTGTSGSDEESPSSYYEPDTVEEEPDIIEEPEPDYDNIGIENSSQDEEFTYDDAPMMTNSSEDE